MAFLDQSEDSVNIAIKTTSDDTGIKETNKNLNSITKTADDTSKKSDDVASNWKSNMNKVAVATAAVGAGLTLYSKSATDYAVNYVKNAKTISRITGDSTEETAKLLAVTNRLGIDTSKVSSIFGIFSKKIAEASGDSDTHRIAQEKLQIQIRATQKAIDDNANEIKKNGDKTGDLTLKQDALKNKLAELQDQAKKTTNPLEGLNVSLKNADGTSRSFSAILLDVSDKFKAMPDGAQKTALAMDLFGRSGKDMIKVLNLGSAGIKDLEAQADKLGLTLTSKNIAQIEAYIKAQKDMKLQTDSLKLSVGLATTPVLTDFQTKLNEVTASLIGMHGPVHTATIDILAFGGPVLGATSAVIGFAANVATMIDGLAKLGFVLANFVWWASFASLAAVAIGGTIVWMHQLGGEWSKISNSIISQSDSAARSMDIAKQKFDAGKISAQQYAQDLRILEKSANDASNAATKNVQNLNGVKGFFNFLTGARASGGPVSSGGAYLVGEQGPEIFQPQNSGTIIPNNKIGSGSGSGITINFNGTVNMSNEQQAQNVGAQLARQLQAARAGAF